jgi:two-component system OmpR family sensor kinase
VRSFRVSLSLRMALSALLLFASVGIASVLALRSILYDQLDGTLLHLAEVEAEAGAAATGSDFEFHEGVLLASREGPTAELTRYAQLWTRDGHPLVRSRNLPADLQLPAEALLAAQRGRVGWATHEWRGRAIRSVVYPLRLVGAAHGVHVLQVAAPTAPVRETLSRFALLVAALTILATAAAYGIGWRLAGIALRPTREITAQAEAIEAGTLSERITANADVLEFGRLVTVLNAMLNRLDRAFQGQRRFTADASHELRGPLNVLRGEIEVALKRERSPGEYRETLQRCREEVLQLSRLAADLLMLARSDAGLPLEQRVEVDLYAVAGRVSERYRSLASERNVRLQVDGTSAEVSGDPSLLERMVANLVDNAVKYSPAGTAVQVELRHDGHSVVLTVRDEGPGIPAEQVPNLFTRFFRGDPARPRAEGSGLGLSIAKAGADAHGGTLEYLGDARGAVFRLTLPTPAAPHT